MKTIELIVPCYNESDVLNIFYDEVVPIMKSIKDFKYKLLFINDGSKDDTLKIIKKLSEKDENVKYISFSRNYGKEAAMLAGLKYSSGQYVGILDADLQHSPHLIPKMLESVLDDEYDIARAKRVDRAGEGKIKSKLADSFYKISNSVSEVEIDHGAQDFCVMKRKVVEAIVSVGDVNRFTKGIFSWVGFKTKWFEHENRERAAGETKWSVKQLTRYAVDGILSFTSAPVRISFYLGLFFGSIGGFYTLFYCFMNFAFNQGINPLNFVLAVLLLMTGIILICIGIVGEYVARIYAQVKERPVFIISQSNLIEDKE